MNIDGIQACVNVGPHHFSANLDNILYISSAFSVHVVS
jgi:hypothetical protein